MGTYEHDSAVAAWLLAKASRTGSAGTRSKYAATMTAFRATLERGGLGLDGPTSRVAALASTFAASSSNNKKDVSPATHNQRLAILSSFYEFAHRRQLLSVPNPIALVERRPVQPYAGARALPYAVVRERLAAIDRSTPPGVRDYALLALLLQTGRRASEVLGLEVGDVAGELVTFRRCKGGKTMEDRLPAPVAAALSSWAAVRTSILQRNTIAPQDIPGLWISLGCTPLGHDGLAAICKKHLGTSRVHATRHTFARAMEDAGAKVSDIQARLGHASLATTGRYLSALSRADNAHAGAVGGLLGLD